MASAFSSIQPVCKPNISVFIEYSTAVISRASNIQSTYTQSLQHTTSPGTTLTSDPYLSIFQKLSKSSLKLHNTIMKQQESSINLHDTIIRQQETLTCQQHFLTELIMSESKSWKEQTQNLQQQLEAILALAPQSKGEPIQ